MFLQLTHPDKVDGLILINCTAKQSGWMEWGYQKVCLYVCVKAYGDLSLFNAVSLLACRTVVSACSAQNGSHTHTWESYDYHIELYKLSKHK